MERRLSKTWEAGALYGYIYKTTLPDGRFYIGKHKSNTKDKYYLGSGILLLRYIKKHGRVGISQEILANAYSLEELNRLEVEYINELNPQLNLAPGGYGGSSPGNGHKVWETRIKNGNIAPWNKGIHTGIEPPNKGSNSGIKTKCRYLECDNYIYRRNCDIKSNRNIVCSKKCQYKLLRGNSYARKSKTK